MASATVIPHVDAVGYPARRWLAVVCAGTGDLFFGGEPRYRALLSGAVGVFAGVLLFRLVKMGSRRRRRCHLAKHCWATVLPPDQFSFPSGHTITAFAMAVTIAHFYPQCWGYLLFLAASIAVWRIILGMHFLSDVVMGALMGVGLGMRPCALHKSGGIVAVASFERPARDRQCL